MSRRLSLLVALLATATPAIAAASATLTMGIQDRRLAIDTGLLPDLDPIDNDQTSVRATFAWDVSDKLTLIAQGGGASSFLELTDVRLNGLTDFRARALFRPTPDWAIGFGSILPFGLYELTAGELTTGQWTWNPRSGFPLGSFGEGFGWEATVARGISLSDNVTAGLAGAYLKHAEFSLLEGGLGDYRLGAETGVSAAIDYVPDPDHHLRLMTAYRMFGADQLNGEDHVDQGNQVEFGIALDTPMGPLATSWGARAVMKGDNTIFDATDPDSVFQLSQAPGTYLSFYSRLAAALGGSSGLFLETTYTTISGSDYVIGTNGHTLSIGPGVGWRASKALSLSGRFAWISGSGARPKVPGAPEKDLTFTGTDVLVTVEVRQ